MLAFTGGVVEVPESWEEEAALDWESVGFDWRLSVGREAWDWVVWEISVGGWVSAVAMLREAGGFCKATRSSARVGFFERAALANF